MITLYIDTSRTEETVIALEEDGKRVEKRASSKEKRSQMVLPLIEELLLEQGKTIHQITDIRLATGPGSFTGLRVGATIAGTISWLLQIPVNGNPPGEIPEIQYGVDLWGLNNSSQS